MALPFGVKPSGRSSAEKESAREVSAYSTVDPELAREAACRQSPKRSKDYRLKMALDKKLQFRKTYDLPLLPPLFTASRHSKRFKFDQRHLKIQFFSCYAVRSALLNPDPVRPLRFRYVRQACVCFSCSKRARRVPRLRNFDTELRYPYSYGFDSANHLESVANAHTAADLHVRPDP